MENNSLKSFKTIYLKTGLSDMEIDSGWNDLESRISPSLKSQFSFPKHALTFIIFAFLFFLTFGFGMYHIAQAALPGQPLYPVKRLSEDLISKTGNKDIKVENRAREIIHLSEEKEKDLQVLHKVVQEYKSNVDELAKESRTPKRKLEVEQKFENHQTEFQKAIEQNPDSKEDLEEAIKATREKEEEPSSTKASEGEQKNQDKDED